MKSPTPARDISRVAPSVKALRAQIAEARRQSETLAQTAQDAKTDYKKVRKIYKHARKLAKHARKELKRLCRTLKRLSTPPAKEKQSTTKRKPTVRKAVATLAKTTPMPPASIQSDAGVSAPA